MGEKKGGGLNYCESKAKENSNREKYDILSRILKKKKSKSSVNLCLPIHEKTFVLSQ